MKLTKYFSNIDVSTCLIKASFIFFSITFNFSAQAASGPSVNQLGQSLDSAWNTLLKISDCDLPPPQDLLCIQKHHGKTITIKLFGQSFNALILIETFTTSNISGPVITQQTGFLIGPIDDFGYRIIRENISYEPKLERQIIDNGVKVFAHSATGNAIDDQGVELNKGQDWLDGVSKRWLSGKREPWIYHWSQLAITDKVLKEINIYLTQNYDYKL